MVTDRILWLSDTRLDQWISDPEERAIIGDTQLRWAQSIARPTTELVFEEVERNSARRFTPWYLHPRAVLAGEIVERVRQAEEDGYDAAFPGMCYGEFFLKAARQAVKMPVVGPAESSMLLAQTLGAKFAVVTAIDDEGFVPIMEENIRARGYESRAIRNEPVRYIMPQLLRLMLDAFAGRPERLIEEFEEQALKSVRDGADVVICGCNPYGAALSYVGYNEVANTGVPVVTPLPAMIKAAESLIDLRRSLGWTKSESLRSPYRSTAPDVLADLTSRGLLTPVIPRHMGDRLVAGV